METQRTVAAFVLDYLREIGAEVRAEGGVHTAVFPAGYKRRFGRERRFTFDDAQRRDQVELVEPGSPLLKQLLLDARGWGPLGAVASNALPAGTAVYTFEFEAFSSLKKRIGFATGLLEPGRTPRVEEGVSSCFFAGSPGGRLSPEEAHALREGATTVLGPVEEAGRAFATDAVRESAEAFAKAVGNVHQYFHGMQQETFLEEARIRKRLGEIQSKLYFTEDGLRELKLQREQERLTRELHELRKRNTQATGSLVSERESHVEKQRRRHEPKLRIRLIGATLVRAAPVTAPTGASSPISSSTAPPVPPDVAAASKGLSPPAEP